VSCIKFDLTPIVSGSNAKIDAVDRSHRNVAQLCAIGGRQIHGKVTQNLTKLSLTDF
jgi:hypothetical protein